MTGYDCFRSSSHKSYISELSFYQFIIPRLPGYELLVIARLDQFSGLDHANRIGVLDRSEFVCDDDDSSTAPRAIMFEIESVPRSSSGGKN